MTCGMTRAAMTTKNTKKTTIPMTMLVREKSASALMSRPPTTVRKIMEMNSSRMIMPSMNSVSGLSSRPSSMRVFIATAEQLMARTAARKIESTSGQPRAVASRKPVNRLTPTSITERMIAGPLTRRILSWRTPDRRRR